MSTLNWILLVAALLIMVPPLFLRGEALNKFGRISTYTGAVLILGILVLCILDTEPKIVEKTETVTQYGALTFSKPVRITTYKKEYQWATVRNSTDRVIATIE
jgi:hypothetical protein